MSLALAAYLRVDDVSSKLSSAGETAAIIIVFVFPPLKIIEIKNTANPKVI